MKEIDKNEEKANLAVKGSEDEKAFNQSLYFREERYISKIGSSVSIKTIHNVNLENFYNDINSSCYNEGHPCRDLNIVLFGDSDGNIYIFEYFFNEREKETHMNKNKYSSIKISKGACTDMVFVPEKNINSTY